MDSIQFEECDNLYRYPVSNWNVTDPIGRSQHLCTDENQFFANFIKWQQCTQFKFTRIKYEVHGGSLHCFRYCVSTAETFGRIADLNVKKYSPWNECDRRKRTKNASNLKSVTCHNLSQNRIWCECERQRNWKAQIWFRKKSQNFTKKFRTKMNAKSYLITAMPSEILNQFRMIFRIECGCERIEAQVVSLFYFFFAHVKRQGK